MNDGRRKTDEFPLDLEQMIIEETDPKHRSFLVAFSSIVTTLTALTDLIRADSKRMTAHIEEYKSDKATRDALINRGKGWRDILVPGIALVQVLLAGACGFFGYVIDAEYKSIRSAISAEQIMNQQQADRLQALETAERIGRQRGEAP